MNISNGKNYLMLKLIIAFIFCKFHNVKDFFSSFPTERLLLLLSKKKIKIICERQHSSKLSKKIRSSLRLKAVVFLCSDTSHTIIGNRQQINHTFFPFLFARSYVARIATIVFFSFL